MMKTLAARLAGILGRYRRGDAGDREIMKSDEAWRSQLTPEQFHVLRRQGTQPPFTGGSAKPDGDGMYRCVACSGALFRADSKFESGTGWPSFADCEASGVELRRDYRMGIPRTEVSCRRCGGHLGHVFADGPTPTRKRYCINDCALASG